MKAANYLVISILLASFVSAEQIIIFNFEYDSGKITLIGQELTQGYYPDRLVQPEEGYSCALVDENNQKLYDFKFELPLREYTDTLDNGDIEGNVVILNQTEFSFIMPFLDKVNEIKCYNLGGYEIISKEIEKTPLSPGRDSFLIWTISLIGLFILIVTLRRKKKI